jgi:hypothetical protein
MLRMGFFSTIKSIFSKKYTPVEALTYLRTKSSWFAQQDHLLQGKRPQFKKIFLSLIPSGSNQRVLTVNSVEDYAKQALARVTIRRSYDRIKAKQGAKVISKAKHTVLAKERKKFENTMAAAFYRQDKLVQKAIQETAVLIQQNQKENDSLVKRSLSKVKNEVRSLEHDMVRVIRRNRGIGHEEAAILRDALKDQISLWEANLKAIEKRVVYHLALPMNSTNKKLAIEALHQLNQQITKSMQEFASIERVQFNIQLIQEDKKEQIAELIKFPVDSKDAAVSAK